MSQPPVLLASPTEYKPQKLLNNTTVNQSVQSVKNVWQGNLQLLNLWETLKENKYGHQTSKDRATHVCIVEREHCFDDIFKC